MKKKITIILFLILAFKFNAKSTNLDSLFNQVVISYDSAGFVYFRPNLIQPGQLFTMYREYWYDDPYNNMVLTKSWTDSIVLMQHNRYQQHFHEVPVEGAEFIEHSKNGYLVYANGRVVEGINNTLEIQLTNTEAFNALLDSLGEMSFIWDNEDFENELKADMEDDDATYLPEGELVWALHGNYELQAFMTGEHYKLAWTFEIISLDPHVHRTYYVDAVTGEIFKSTEHICNGTANVLTGGSHNSATSETIDTRWFGGLTNKYVLHSNSNGRRIHTKYYNNYNVSWATTSNIKDDDDSWGNSEQMGTTAHWMVTQAYDFFSNTYYRTGLQPNKDVRVLANADDPLKKAYYRSKGKNDYLVFSDLTEGYYAVLDVAGHEYGHGIDQHTANLKYEKESGALDESFADIYGFMVERYKRPSTFTWTIGEEVNTLRDMSNPKSFESPNTYQGEFWISQSGCSPNYYNDFCGVHRNSGVQNYWFYLLSEGGTGTNDNDDNYNVDAIGIDKAAQITYWNHVNNQMQFSNFLFARAGSIATAIILFGKCSAEQYQVENAWYAVGVGSQSTCPPPLSDNLSISQRSTNFTVYPNPTNGNVNIRFKDDNTRELVIMDLRGTRLIHKNTTSNLENLDISPFAKGIYFLQVKEGNSIQTIKISKFE
jgi:bacillolysin